MEFEKLKPLAPLNEEEEKLNKDNEWLKAVRGESNRGKRAIRKPRISSRLVSRTQRIAVINEKDAEASKDLNKKQRKATNG